MDMIIVELKKLNCTDHRLEYIGGDSTHSEFGCSNCKDSVVELEDAGTGA
jgi:hypothetical protein